MATMPITLAVPGTYLVCNKQNWIDCPHGQGKANSKKVFLLAGG